ncbi:MAG TPA: hypothetical protein GX008_02580 [Firmicutes bacterium]|nr:hypothetical protein [Bacillota bacterium]
MLLGNPRFYGRFGFGRASQYGLILWPGFERDHLLVLELREGARDGVQGKARYCSPFYNAAGELL